MILSSRRFLAGMPPGNGKIRGTTAENFVPQKKKKNFLTSNKFFFNPQNFRGSPALLTAFHIETRTANLYLYKYENVCLSAHVFLGHFETDWETLWHKAAFCF